VLSKSFLIIIILGIVLAIILYFLLFYSQQIFSASWQYVPTILGAIGTAYSLFERIYKQISAKKENIVIKFDDIVKIKPPDIQVYHMMYFLRIRKSKGESIAKSVRGYLTIEGTEIQNIPLQWYMERSPTNNIDDFKDLWIFSADNYNADYSAIFIAHSSDFKYRYFSKRKKDVLQKKIKIRIESENAKSVKEPFSDTIENIISKAKDMYEA